MTIHEKTIKQTSSFFTFIFSVNIVFQLLRLENSPYYPIEFNYYVSQTNIELVISQRPEGNLTFQQTSVPQPIVDADCSTIHLSLSQRLWLNYYNDYVLIQLNSFNKFFSPNQQLISILQKGNISHKSADLVSPLFS